MMNEVLIAYEYIMEQDDTFSDEGKRKMVGGAQNSSAALRLCSTPSFTWRNPPLTGSN